MGKKNESKKNGSEDEKITNFKKLGEVFQASVELDLPDPMTIAPGDIAKKAEIIDTGQKKVQEWTKNLLTKIGQRAAAVNKIEDPGQKKIAKKLADDANTAELKALDTYLRGDKDAFYRRAAWLAVMEYLLSGNPQTPKELTEILEKMVANSYLVKNPDGFLKPYGDGYDFHPDCPFDETEKMKVRMILTGLRNKVFENGKVNIIARSNLSVRDFLDGKPGEIALSVHAEKAMRGGQEFWRSGGVLLVKSDGKVIHPLDANGGIEKSVQEAIKMGAYLYFDSLFQPSPPFIKSLTEEMNGKIQFLWHLLKRGLLRYEFAAEATLSQEELFLEEKCGNCFLDLRGTWQTGDGKTIANFFFLISRREENGVKRIRIAKAPNHLNDVFAQCLGEYEEGNKFEGVPYPLRAVLQAVYGQVRDNAGKTAQITP